jgi:hypothetical protein
LDEFRSFAEAAKNVRFPTQEPNARDFVVRAEKIAGGVTALPSAKRLKEIAENCADMADSADNEASRRRYRRMEQSYLRLAETEEWLDGQVSPFAQQDTTVNP